MVVTNRVVTAIETPNDRTLRMQKVEERNIYFAQQYEQHPDPADTFWEQFSPDVRAKLYNLGKKNYEEFQKYLKSPEAVEPEKEQPKKEFIAPGVRKLTPEEKEKVELYRKKQAPGPDMPLSEYLTIQESAISKNKELQDATSAYIKQKVEQAEQAKETWATEKGIAAQELGKELSPEQAKEVLLFTEATPEKFSPFWLIVNSMQTAAEGMLGKGKPTFTPDKWNSWITYFGELLDQLGLPTFRKAEYISLLREAATAPDPYIAAMKTLTSIGLAKDMFDPSFVGERERATWSGTSEAYEKFYKEDDPYHYALDQLNWKYQDAKDEIDKRKEGEDDETYKARVDLETEKLDEARQREMATLEESEARKKEHRQELEEYEQQVESSGMDTIIIGAKEPEKKESPWHTRTYLYKDYKEFVDGLSAEEREKLFARESPIKKADLDTLYPEETHQQYETMMSGTHTDESSQVPIITKMLTKMVYPYRMLSKDVDPTGKDQASDSGDRDFMPPSDAGFGNVAYFDSVEYKYGTKFMTEDRKKILAQLVR